MLWRRTKAWSRSPRKGAEQPTRSLYLRTLSNLANPSEVRGVLSMSRMATVPDEQPLSAVQIDFAQRLLPFEYSEVVDLMSGNKHLLFATHEDGPRYSELHMAGGERTVFRLSQEVAHLEGALVLIDEVEAGLHPWVQQLLMMQLQQLALRNNLQIIVTTHSPVILDSVPAEARVFLDREPSGQVHVHPPYRDLIQNALYGRSSDTLHVLCEDDAAEGILNGILDVLRPKMNLDTSAIQIGRDTGADEFPSHAGAFRKFGLVESFVFVLDGDKRHSQTVEKISKSARTTVPIIFLPGESAPEIWIWDVLRTADADLAATLGDDPATIVARTSRLNAIYDSASDTASRIAKAKIQGFAEETTRTVSEICRIVARVESERKDSEIQPAVTGLQDALLIWRSQ